MNGIHAGSILVIDDDPLVLAAFRRVTKDLKARLRFANDAEEGWRMVQAEVPELIICDYKMPGADGLAFLQRVHRRFPEVKRILHTALPVPGGGAGHDVPVLDKPCAPETLRELLMSITSPPGRAP